MASTAPPTAITHEPAASRFLFKIPEGEGVIEYAIEPASSASKGKQVLNLTHTFTEPGLRGKGVAAKLADAAFLYAKEHGMAVRPSCTYISDTYLPGKKSEAANWSFDASAKDALAFPNA